jgi:hypothetical protein
LKDLKKFFLCVEHETCENLFCKNNKEVGTSEACTLKLFMVEIRSVHKTIAAATNKSGSLLKIILQNTNIATIYNQYETEIIYKSY